MDTNLNKFISKNGRTIMILAQELFSYEVGGRIRTVSDYVELVNSSRGTVQLALKFLQNEDCIQLEARGHLGTFLINIDHKKLWVYTNFGVIMGAMPLPYSKRYEGLATGLYKAFKKKGIPFSLAFMRGSNKRLEALKLGKYSFVVISKLAAEIYQENHDDLSVIHEFSPGTYVGNHAVIFREDNHILIQPGMRVGLDYTSIDQSILTKNECQGIQVDYIDTPYNQILKKLEINEIDVAIWNIDEIKEKNIDVNIQPLKNKNAIKMDINGRIAVVVVNNKQLVIGRIMNRLLDLTLVEEIQNQVIENAMIPTY